MRATIVRASSVLVRPHPEEKELLRLNAGLHGLSVSDYARQNCLNFHLRKTPMEKERLCQLARIGANLNQLAKWANTHKQAVEAVEVLTPLSNLARESDMFMAVKKAELAIWTTRHYLYCTQENTPMELALIAPHYDVAFKKIFCTQTIDVLADFLGATLDLPVDEYQDIRVVDPHLLRRHKNDKLGIVDLRITTKSGHSIAVELQVAAHPAIWQRMEYYNAKLLIDQMDAGTDFNQIHRAISILIYYPVLIKETKEFHNIFARYDKRTQISYPYSSEIHVLEVHKAKQAGDSPLANWLRFFAAETTEAFTMISQTRPAIAKAWGVVQVLSGDAEARRLAEYEEMSRRDNAARMQGAYTEGRQEGILEVARNLLQDKTAVDVVARATGLSLDEIERLAADLS